MKRPVLLLIAVLMLGPQNVGMASAQEYPTRQITLIAPWPAGGAIDTLCRLLAPYFADRLGKPMVVENRPGAASVIGTAAGAKSPPDGYTLVMAGSGSLPVHSISELVQYAREHPGGRSYASGGPGSPHHLQAEMLQSMTGIEMMHVPYKGSAPALTDVIAGHVPLMFSDVVPALPQIREGKVRALGVSTSVRLPSAPDIPTLAEEGVGGFDAAGWGVISVPAGTPIAVVDRLRATLNGILPLPEVARQIIALGLLPAGASAPGETARFIDAEIERWGKVIRQAGLAGTE